MRIHLDNNNSRKLYLGLTKDHREAIKVALDETSQGKEHDSRDYFIIPLDNDDQEYYSSGQDDQPTSNYLAVDYLVQVNDPRKDMWSEATWSYYITLNIVK